jgi:hypothetical protein
MSNYKIRLGVARHHKSTAIDSQNAVSRFGLGISKFDPNEETTGASGNLQKRSRISTDEN